MISYAFPDPDRIARAIAADAEAVIEALSAGLAEVGLLAEREIRERTPTSGAGTLRDSIASQPVEISGTRVTLTVGSSLAYVEPVELGSRPHMPPVAPLVDWVRRRLGLRGAEAERVGFAIARKIARVGTPPAYMFAEGLKAVEPQMDSILGPAMQRALARAGVA